MLRPVLKPGFTYFHLPSHYLKEYKKVMPGTVSDIFLDPCSYISIISDWPSVLKKNHQVLGCGAGVKGVWFGWLGFLITSVAAGSILVHLVRFPRGISKLPQNQPDILSVWNNF